MNHPQHLLPSRPDQIVVLVVDDEPLIRNILRIALEKEGYFVFTAGDGEEALQVARACPCTIHLLVSDVVMPRLDGYELRRLLLAERPATQALMISGQVSEPSQGPFLRKPFVLTALTQAVRNALSAERQPAAVASR